MNILFNNQKTVIFLVLCRENRLSGSLNTQSATVGNEHKEQHPISDNAQPFQVPEYLRQPESSGSVANEPKQDEPKHTPFADNSAENSLSGSLKDTQAEQSQTESVGDKYPKFDKLLGRHEGGYDDFNAKNGSKYTAHRGEEIADGKKLSDLTVGEVMQMQKNGELFAAGHYQITPLAMKDAVRLAGGVA